MSKRQSILDALKTLLQTIKVSNGFNTNLGDYVFHWQEYPVEYNEESLVIRDPDEDYEEKNNNYQCVLHIEIESRVFSNNPGLAGNQALQDVLKAIGSDVTFSGLATRTKLITNEKQVETEGRSACSILLKIDVIYLVREFQF